MGVKMVSHIEGELAEGVGERCAEEDIWT